MTALLTDFQKIALVTRITGKRITLGMMESVSDCVILEKQILLSINRARVDFRRGQELVVTHRGYTMWTWHLQEGVWKYPEPVTYWFDDAVPEVHKPYVTPPEEKLAKKDWEDMCYRPGSAQHPLDGPNARLV